MKTLGSGLFVLSLCAAIMLGGCGQSQQAIQVPTVTPQAAPLASSQASIPSASGLSAEAELPLKASPLIYASNSVVTKNKITYKVSFYPEAGSKKALGNVRDGVFWPWGIYVDKNGTLYVANESPSAVMAYPKGATSPLTTWSQDLSRSLYPIVDSGGNLWVSNAGNGTVVEYLAGSTAAYQVLQTPGVEADGMDFDAQGDLYVAYRTSNCNTCGSIEEFAPGSTQGLILGMTLNEPQGLIVDNNNNILVVETGTTKRIDLFKPGEQTPSQEVPAPLHSGFNQLAIEANESELFISGWSRSRSSVFMTAYPFPTSPKLTEVPSPSRFSSIYGVALSNEQTF